jgi:hypothetical protein
LPNKLTVFDGNSARVCEVSADIAEVLVHAGMAKTVGRHKIRHLLMTVERSTLMAIVRGIDYPLNQGSRTFRKILIVNHPVYEHHKQRCRAFGRSPLSIH